jgi:hypothetical protein
MEHCERREEYLQKQDKWKIDIQIATDKREEMHARAKESYAILCAQAKEAYDRRAVRV